MWSGGSGGWPPRGPDRRARAAAAMAGALCNLALAACTSHDTATSGAPVAQAPTVSPGVPVSVAPPRRSAGLTARYITANTSDGGYEARIAIATMVPVTGWSAVLTLPEGVRVTASWDADFRQEGRTLTLTPKPWNDSVSPGQAITIGFRADGTGQPTTCTVNGVTCAK